MIPTPHPVACERVRAQVSLELDGELSQLERAMLAAHALRCAGCRAYREDLRAFTEALRAAALESVPEISVRRYRRPAAAKLQAGLAAAMAFAFVGIGSQALSGRQEGSPASTLRVTQFQTQSELEREQALIERPESRTSGEATVR